MPESTPQSTTSQEKSVNVSVPQEEWESMRQKMALTEMEELVVKRVKRHFAWVAIIGAIAGLAGINAVGYALISEQLAPELTNVRKATAKANAEATLASQTLSTMNITVAKAKADAELSLENANAQNARIGMLQKGLETRAIDLDNRFRSISADSNNVRAQLETTFKELDSRLESLAANVPTARAEQTALKAASTLDLFQENSAYEIHFSVFGNTHVVGLIDIIEYFGKRGFKITGNDLPKSTGQFASQIGTIQIAYTEKGKEKLDYIVAEIKKISDFDVIPDRAQYAGNLVGDIQITVQSNP
jgi:hypothetical protein